MPPTPDVPGPHSSSRLRTTIVLVCVAALGVAAFFGARAWWVNQELYPTTEDALVNANFIAIKPQVTGNVASIAVRENQLVQAGELLFEIDRAPFEAAERAAEATLTLTKADVVADKSTIAAAEAEVDNARQLLASAKAAAAYAQTIFDDTKKLNAAGEATPKELAQASAQLDEANAAVMSATATLARDEATLSAEKVRIGDPNVEAARIAKAEAELAIARINLDYTRVTAPAPGHVTRFDLRKGQVVNAGETQFYLIESDDWWVDANFKETQLDRIKQGMKAQVTLDLYPDVTYSGVVESVSRGSAASFSLLPPENATGNWVKVTQRITVRVRLDGERPDAPFRKGANARVTIDTTVPPAAATP